MRQRALLLVLLLALLGGGGIFLYYRQQEARYVSTDNARVAADLVPVGPEIPGRLEALKVRPGDRVKAGAVLGEVSTEALAQSAQANPQALPQAAPLAARRALILAPFTGTVVQVAAAVGQYLGAGQPALYLADLDQAYISANVDENQVHRLRPGLPVEVRVDALPGRVLRGVVEEIGEAAASAFSLLPDTNANTGNFTKVTQVVPVRIGLLDRPDAPLGPGMSASVRIHVQDAPLTTQGRFLKAEARRLPVRLEVAGSLVAGTSLAAVSEVAGTLAEVRVQVGDKVEPGTVLARLENPVLEAQIRSARAALAQAEEAARAAQAAYLQAERTYARVQALYGAGAASRQDLEAARTQRDAALAQYQGASEGAVAQARGALAALLAQEAKLLVRSPIRGQVAGRNAEVGQAVGAGQVLFTLVGEGPMRFEAILPAREAAWVRPGLPAQVRLEGYGVLEGRVLAVAASAIPTGDYFPVEIQVEGRDLRPGVRGLAQIATEAQGVYLPRTALRWMGGQAYAFVREGEGLRRLALEVLYAGPEGVLVEGLAPGAEVLEDARAGWEGAVLAGTP